jgi:hypothetical protein
VHIGYDPVATGDPNDLCAQEDRHRSDLPDIENLTCRALSRPRMADVSACREPTLGNARIESMHGVGMA